MSLGPVVSSRLEKAAGDNGFDLSIATVPGWLAFASSQTTLRLWMTFTAESTFVVALSRPDVARALVDDGAATSSSSPVPAGAAVVVGVIDFAALHGVVRRAFQLSRSLPDELLHAFEREAASLPRATEAERLVVQRVGQNIFRRGLLDYWNGRCAVTGLAVTELLRASHIKAWAKCATDAERLDVFNGLLLSPNLDAAFDVGLITVRDDGVVVVSPTLDAKARETLGLVGGLKVTGLADGHRQYLPWHREVLFRKV